MSDPTELGRYLRARRARVDPADVGLPAGIGQRRTPGLRREELAALAGVSVDYYTRLERGKETRPSEAVIRSLSSALRLDEHECAYLNELAQVAARRAPEPRRPAPSAARPSLKGLLEMLRPNPAYLVGHTNDILATTPGAVALLDGIADWPERQRNTIRYTFLHPAARKLWLDWDVKAWGCVAHLRAVAGANPDDPELAALIGELIVKSPDFGRLWERYDVRRITYGSKAFRHPVIGDLTLDYDVLFPADAEGQRLVVYQARGGSADQDALVLLDMMGSEALTQAQARDQARPRTRPASIAADPTLSASWTGPGALPRVVSESAAGGTAFEDGSTDG